MQDRGNEVQTSDGCFFPVPPLSLVSFDSLSLYLFGQRKWCI